MLTRTTYKGSVYLSGPITGLTYEDARNGWRFNFAAQLKHGITVLSPMRHEGHLAELQGELDQTYPEHPFSTGKMLVAKDKLDIERCEVMVVNLLGAKKVSIGTVMEIGMAYQLGKTIVLVMEDAGKAVIGETTNGAYGIDDTLPIYGNNFHEHPFVTEPAAVRVNNLDAAVAIVNSLLSEGV
jgi:nucleoside 2-deoxyribosyltransferase